MNEIVPSSIFPGTQIKAVSKKGRTSAGAEQFIVQDLRSGDFFLVSGVHAMFTGWEVLVFRCDENGEVESFLDVAGGRAIDGMDAIIDLERRIQNNSLQGEDDD